MNIQKLQKVNIHKTVANAMIARDTGVLCFDVNNTNIQKCLNIIVFVDRITLYLAQGIKNLRAMKKKTVTDRLNFDDTKSKGLQLLKDETTEREGLYILIAIHTGLRISDIISLTWEQLRHWKRTDWWYMFEKKTLKPSRIKMPEGLKPILESINLKREGWVFAGRRTDGKQPYISTQQMNGKLKDIFKREVNKGYKISSHSLRKTFGYEFWKAAQRKGHSGDEALMYLSKRFNHTSITVTRTYLGITQDHINDIVDIM